ncbi:hypothetical protein [Rhodohalobacter sp. SW132]|uniref:hypothetical protein n=1 Tax=Rhodohalobacter sp. SW132 TaxID=2293433 RepID=UPI0011C08395|nr:hypothetical protein [Rhodohalobacter sp. SW132]
MNYRKLRKRREFSEQIRHNAVKEFRPGTMLVQVLCTETQEHISSADELSIVIADSDPRSPIYAARKGLPMSGSADRTGMGDPGSGAGMTISKRNYVLLIHFPLVLLVFPTRRTILLKRNL